MHFIIFGLLLVFGTEIVDYFVKKSENKSSGKSNRFNNLRLLLIFAGIVVTLWSSCNANREEKKSKLLQKKAERKADSISKQIIEKQEQLKVLTQKNEKSQDKIILLQTNQLDKQDSLIDNQIRQLETSKSIFSTSSTILKQFNKNDSIQLVLYDKRLKNSFFEASKIFDNILFGDGNNTLDTVNTRNIYRGAVEKARAIAASELNNPIVLADTNLYKIWNLYNERMNDLHWDVSGYNRIPIQVMFDKVYQAVVRISILQDYLMLNNGSFRNPNKEVLNSLKMVPREGF